MLLTPGGCCNPARSRDLNDDEANENAEPGAPQIDMLSPNIYVMNFTEWCEWFTQSDCTAITESLFLGHVPTGQ